MNHEDFGMLSSMTGYQGKFAAAPVPVTGIGTKISNWFRGVGQGASNMFHGARMGAQGGAQAAKANAAAVRDGAELGKDAMLGGTTNSVIGGIKGAWRGAGHGFNASSQAAQTATRQAGFGLGGAALTVGGLGAVGAFGSGADRAGGYSRPAHNAYGGRR